MQPLDTNSCLALLQILEDFYERKSVIITSQLPSKNWYDYIGEPTLADAIMDRITSNSIRVEIKGESMRRKEKKREENKTFMTRLQLLLDGSFVSDTVAYLM